MPIGSRLMVWKGQADHTAGGLRKEHLMLNKRGKVVSIRAHKAGLIAFKRNGLKAKTGAEMKSMRGGRDH